MLKLKINIINNLCYSLMLIIFILLCRLDEFLMYTLCNFDKAFFWFCPLLINFSQFIVGFLLLKNNSYSEVELIEIQ